MQTLSASIRLGREKMGWSQEEVANKVATTKQWISLIERGVRLPSLDLLVKLHEVLVAVPIQEHDISLTEWLLKWVEEQASIKGKQNKKKIDDNTKKAIQTAIKRATNQLQPTIQSKGWRPGMPRLLTNFPEAFEPLTIICGDRREPQPRTRGDIFAYSVSIADLTFLLRLGLQDKATTIRSDKLFVCMDEEYLRREFGKTNLLVIGSTAVNFAARAINNYSIFRFNLGPEMNYWQKQLRELKVLNDPYILQVFWQMAQDPDNISPGLFEDKNLSSDQVKELTDMVKRLPQGEKVKYLMNEFRKPGYVDPADGVVHAQFTRQDNDFGVISLARNPFSDSTDYVCIMVGGIHGPGTAHALRALAEDNFKDHPYGGVIEVELDPFKAWPDRFEQAHWKWQTHKYTKVKLLANLQNAIEQDPPKTVFSRWTKEEIKDCANFVQSVSGEDKSYQP